MIFDGSIFYYFRGKEFNFYRSARTEEAKKEREQVKIQSEKEEK